MGSAPPASESFLSYLEGRHVRLDYAIDDFLYGHDGPCPQVSTDHPFGQAAEVLNLPQKEWDDWQTHVGDYYKANMFPFAEHAAEFSFKHTIESGLMGYAPVSDAEFCELVTEGLYSKFLCSTLDAPDRQTFAQFLPKQPDGFVYLKSDFSCMEVITETWKDEYVAPTVVLLRRPENDPYAYEVVAIALRYWDANAEAFVPLDAPLTSADGEAWRLAKYFVLQGAIHRINLIDHTEVHFPSDSINAITKTVLPKRNLVFQLLEPHFWLSLPVNNTVLEGERSIISRSTWYPWSPFVAKGPVVRRLLPLGWYGSMYDSDQPNSAYPPYRFRLDPEVPPSRYGAFFEAYHAAILAFTRKVVAQIPPDDGEHPDWIEIQSWANQISVWVPGFPHWSEFLAETDEQRAKAEDTLARTVATLILNAAVIHSSDHRTLHKMITEKPVPFVLRVPPPQKASWETAFPKELEAVVATVEKDVEKLIEKAAGPLAEKVLEGFVESHLNPYLRSKLSVLCWPTDLIYARMADLLFYLPHNASLLDDCNYAFAKTKGPLATAVGEFKQGLAEVAKAQQPNVDQYGFPMLAPPANAKGAKKAKIRQQDCIAAGVQY